MTTATVAEYDKAFGIERLIPYPAIDAIEARLDYSIGRAKLHSAARVLACPVKGNPPNWQHGRVLYALARNYIEHMRPTAKDNPDGLASFMFVPEVAMLDIGTAKGFSALCLQWAMDDSGALGLVTSVDVINPESHVRRNTVAECDGAKTLGEILEPWPEAQSIQFLCEPGAQWLARTTGRVYVAFIDGKHEAETVRLEGTLLAARQQPGDIAMFDDCQIPGVGQAVSGLREYYTFEHVSVLPHRMYAIGVRR